MPLINLIENSDWWSEHFNDLPQFGSEGGTLRAEPPQNVVQWLWSCLGFDASDFVGISLFGVQTSRLVTTRLTATGIVST